jgi:vacuolar-type H+-ATPase subunit I/STV1
MNRESIDILLFVGRVVGWLLIMAGIFLFALGISQLLTLLLK